MTTRRTRRSMVTRRAPHRNKLATTRKSLYAWVLRCPRAHVRHALCPPGTTRNGADPLAASMFVTVSFTPRQYGCPDLLTRFRRPWLHPCIFLCTGARRRQATQKPPQHTAQLTCSRHRGCVATYAVAITKVCGRVEAAGGRTPQLTERQEPALPPLVGPLCVFRRIGTDCANELLYE